jgi:hypothetical protein
MTKIQKLARDYPEARQAFLTAAERAGAEIGQERHPGKGPDGGELYLDTAWLGPRGRPFPPIPAPFRGG